MKTLPHKTLIIFLLSVLLVACAGTSSDAGTPVADNSTNQDEESADDVVEEAETDEAKELVATEEPKSTETLPPTVAPVTAHTYNETPIRPFNADDFILYLGRVRDSYRGFNSEIGLFTETVKPGGCGTFFAWTQLWILEAPGYTDVPSDWQALYVEYRDMLRQVVTVTAEIRPLCTGQQGERVSLETTQSIVTFLSWAYPRSEQMIIEANQIPR